MEKIEKIIEEIKQLSILEVSQLVKKLEEEFDLAPLVMAPQAGTATTEGADSKTEEKSSYNVKITNAGEKKINVIKVIREFRQDLGLKDAKALIDSVPSVVMENVPAEEAKEAQKKLEEAGATVELE